MAGAESAVVFDAHLGGYPVTVLGIESRPLRRTGFMPADGPDQWTAGTLFPSSSKRWPGPSTPPAATGPWWC